ncbi:MAG: hypothetical protein GY822_20620 [Deltaproteobacteria bacterium]|nr:hypothetical protein [Deltaproteobacteria bacterium]
MHYAPRMEFIVAIVLCLVLLVIVYMAFKMLKLVLRLVLLTVFGVVVLGFLLTFGRPTLEKVANGLRREVSTDAPEDSGTQPEKIPQPSSRESNIDDGGGLPNIDGGSFGEEQQRVR